MIDVRRFVVPELSDRGYPCPICFSRTRVCRTISNRRYRKCMKCKYGFTTIELDKGMVDEITNSLIEIKSCVEDNIL